MPILLQIFQELKHKIDFGRSLSPLIITLKPILFIDLLDNLFELQSLLEITLRLLLHLALT